MNQLEISISKRMSLEAMPGDDMLPQQRTPGVLEQLESDLPEKLAAPARRALIGAGVWRLEQLAGLSQAEVKALHGIGGNAMKLLQQALESRGLGFRE